jgi:CDP-paratose 2-epimerase
VRILITGACGFVGTTLVKTWVERGDQHQFIGLDNYSRPGSEQNRLALRHLGVDLRHGDIRSASDFESLPPVDWVIDAAANPSVLAGVDGRTSSRQLVEHNLLGTVNILEYCRSHRAGFVLLSTSRVYSIESLLQLSVLPIADAFRPAPDLARADVSVAGVTEEFSTAGPRSMYGTTKLASEDLALEYGAAFDLPVWINRCGVLAGGEQFGRPDQGIFSYWIHSWAQRKPLAYIGFDGLGHQVRDCLHPRDLVPLIESQMHDASRSKVRVQNVSGGLESAASLRQCSEWCTARFGPHAVTARPEHRQFDVPWLVLDSALAVQQWAWAPATPREAIFEEIARHAEKRADWLEVSAT